MKLTLANAKMFYNKAEKQVKSNFPNYNFFERAEAIDKILDRKYGEDIAGKIVDSVFENEIG